MNIVYAIKHWLQVKIYHACYNIQQERNRNRIDGIIQSMQSHGRNMRIHDSAFIAGAKYMQVGDDCKFGINAWVECVAKYFDQKFSPQLIIGDNFNMQYNCHIGCINRVEIGNNVLLGSKIYITDHYHGEISREALSLPPIKRPLWSKPVKIGDNVWIGDNVSIMPGVELGDNVIVGANAVVTHSFPANTVIAGVPARVIKTLS